MLFYNLILKIGKRKEEHDTLLREKNKRKTEQCQKYPMNLIKTKNKISWTK